MSKKIDDLIGKTRNRIQAVGVELEGAWNKLPPGIAGLEHDGSVRFQAFPHASPAQRWLTGEIPSPPMKPEEIYEWLKVHYPQAVNDTCGMHVHLSFRSALHYQRLMVPGLTTETVRLFREWAAGEPGIKKDHPIWARLDGKSNYCQPKFDAEAQSKMSRKSHDMGVPGNRYTMWNYCYGLHNTVECRLLPMFQDSKQAWAAIQRLFDIVNAFLALHNHREVEQVASIIADESSLMEEIRLSV